MNSTEKRTPWSRKKKVFTVSAIVLTAHIIGALTSVHALMTTRSAQGATAWVVSLNAMPYIAVPAYWVFGHNDHDEYVEAHREVDLRIRNELDKKIPKDQSSQIFSSAGASHLIPNHLADLPMSQFNEVNLLVDGEETFTAMTRAIDDASDYVLFQFYIIRDDEVGQHFKDLLIKKARQGVRVYFLFDAVGSHKLDDSYREALENAGIRVASFSHEDATIKLFRLNFRNHRKIVVVDGKEVFLGGLNIGNEYMGNTEKFSDWRDTHLHIRGPAALGAQMAFVRDWNWSEEEILDLTWTPRPSETAGINAVSVATGPADEVESAKLLFLNAINSATKRLWIATPYFVPDDAIESALVLAVARGVDVRILVPDKTDSLLVEYASYSYYDEALPLGIRFFQYQDGFMHSKTVLVDDHLSYVTSANLDNRSFRLNFEIFGIVDDETLARNLERMFLADFANSEELKGSVYSEKPWWFHVASRAARLTAPIL